VPDIRQCAVAESQLGQVVGTGPVVGRRRQRGAGGVIGGHHQLRAEKCSGPRGAEIDIADIVAAGCGGGAAQQVADMAVDLELRLSDDADLVIGLADMRHGCIGNQLAVRLVQPGRAEGDRQSGMGDGVGQRTHGHARAYRFDHLLALIDVKHRMADRRAGAETDQPGTRRIGGRENNVADLQRIGPDRHAAIAGIERNLVTERSSSRVYRTAIWRLHVARGCHWFGGQRVLLCRDRGSRSVSGVRLCAAVIGMARTRRGCYRV